jgi:hypothetical protein
MVHNLVKLRHKLKKINAAYKSAYDKKMKKIKNKKIKKYFFGYFLF